VSALLSEPGGNWICGVSRSKTGAAIALWQCGRARLFLGLPGTPWAAMGLHIDIRAPCGLARLVGQDCLCPTRLFDVVADFQQKLKKPGRREYLRRADARGRVQGVCL